jgi:hypothetical protein
MTLYLILICICLVAAVVLYAIISSNRSGKNEEKLKQAKKVLENVKDANEAINRARADKSIAGRLREKYGLK